jgi:hypothetical protein
VEWGELMEAALERGFRFLSPYRSSEVSAEQVGVWLAGPGAMASDLFFSCEGKKRPGLLVLQRPSVWSWTGVPPDWMLC